jgi:vitamin B12 transporter
VRSVVFVAAFLAAFVLPAAGFAENLQPGIVQPGIVVTATRTAQTVDELLAPVTVITREDIENSQAQSLQELLRGTPGLSVSNNGGMGKVTSFFLRGTESDHVLVLIDGTKVGSATVGTTAFQHLPLDNIERIEIVRGPHSSLYGSEAVGGVIQIFTRKKEGKFTPNLSVSAGSYDTQHIAGSLSYGNDHRWIHVTAAGLTSNGFNACKGEPGVGGCFTSEPDIDGYKRRSGSANIGFRIARDTGLNIAWLRADGETQFDGSFVNESDSVQDVLSAGVNTRLLASWYVNLKAGSSTDEEKNYLNGSFRTRFKTQRDSASLRNDFSMKNGGLLSLGMDYLNDKINSTTDYAVTSRDNKGVYVQYQQPISRQQILVRARRDDNEQFGGKQTGGVAWGLAISAKARLIVSYGTAFKAPTFNELYYPGFGNPDLKPETSENYEISLRIHKTRHRLSVTAYQTVIDNLIGFDATSGAPANIDQARINGIEAQWVFTAIDWAIKSNATWLDPENRASSVNNGNELPRRAPASLRIDVDKTIARSTIGMTVIAEGRRYDDLANTQSLAGYATLDWRAATVFRNDWRLQFSIKNILDKDYETAAYYNQPGRTLQLGLTYQP